MLSIVAAPPADHCHAEKKPFFKACLVTLHCEVEFSSMVSSFRTLLGPGLTLSPSAASWSSASGTTSAACSSAGSSGLVFYNHSKFPPGLVAQGYKQSICMATLIDVHAHGSLLDNRRERNSSCYYPLYPNGGQWLPYTGHDLFPSPFSTLNWRLWVETL